jgi:flagellar motor switch/type III secretory pathway protein FliN
MSLSHAPRPVPLLLLGESRRRLLLQRLERVVADWHAAWASEGIPPPTVELPAAASVLDSGRQCVALAAFTDGELLSHVEADPDFVKALCVSSHRERLSLSFTSARGRLEGALTEQVLGALLTALVGFALPTVTCAVRKGGREVLDEAGLHWHRRAFRVRVVVGHSEGRRTLELDAAPCLVEGFLGGRPEVSGTETLSARRHAVEAERVTVTISLGSASVSWGELTALSVGDAIVLDQDLNAACTLSVSGSKAVAEAHLGRIDRALAVQIARIHAHERRERK